MIPERAVSLHQAERRIDQWFQAAGLQPQIACHGSHLSSTVVTLIGDTSWQGDRVGCGKGYAHEARVGAKYEAYEHLVATDALRAVTTLAPCTQVLGQSTLQDLLPLRLLSAPSDADIGVISFEANAQGYPPLDYPAFLVDYTYALRPHAGDHCDYSRARRYACGTGLAAGGDEVEALIHAVGEVIERHAVGRYIARVYYRGDHNNAAELDRDTLPYALKALLHEAESTLGAAIVLNSAASDIDCPVVMARCSQRTIAGLHVLGSGASLHGAHAAARAIKELVQQYKVVEGEAAAVKHWDACRRRLERWPRLHDSLRLRPVTGGGERLDFRCIAGQQTPLPLAQHLAMLERRCAQADRPVWTRVLRKEPSDVVLGCAVMPRMERFAIAALGGVVVPCYG